MRATFKNGSDGLCEPLIYHESSGQERPSAVEQLPNRVCGPMGHESRQCRLKGLVTRLRAWVEGIHVQIAWLETGGSRTGVKRLSSFLRARKFGAIQPRCAIARRTRGALITDNPWEFAVIAWLRGLCCHKPACILLDLPLVENLLSLQLQLKSLLAPTIHPWRHSLIGDIAWGDLSSVARSQYPDNRQYESSHEDQKHRC